MKGNQKIIDALNGLLAMELAAMDQYFIHSQMYLDWGLQKLYDRISHEFDDEKGHATVLIERMLFLEGVPDMVTRDGFKVGSDIKSMLESDLRVEYEVASRLRSAIALCEQERGFVTKARVQDDGLALQARSTPYGLVHPRGHSLQFQE